MKDALPSYVHLKNPYFSTESVLTEEGRRDMMKTVLRKFIQNGKWFKKAAYMLRVWKQMHKKGKKCQIKSYGELYPMEVNNLMRLLIWL